MDSPKDPRYFLCIPQGLGVWVGESSAGIQEKRPQFLPEGTIFNSFSPDFVSIITLGPPRF